MNALAVLLVVGVLFALLKVSTCYSIQVQDSQTMGIGKWTATKMQPLGTIIKTVDSNGSPKSYMYVQHAVGSGAVAYDGAPCGFTTSTVNGTYQVSGDVSAVFGNSAIGVYRCSTTSAITTAYYGWIQLAVPGEILDSCVLLTQITTGDLVYWTADGLFGTCPRHTSANTEIALGVCLGGIITTPQNPSTTANVTGNVLIMLGI
jgi:hypothetical protein